MSSLEHSSPGTRKLRVAAILVPVLVFLSCAIAFLWFVFFRVQYTISLEPIKASPGLYDSGMLWKRRGLGRWNLVHGFIFKNGAHGTYETKSGWRTGHTKSHNMHKGEGNSIRATMTRDELVVDGSALIATPDSRVFVLTGRGNHSAVSLTPDELSLFHPDVYPRCLTETDFWKSKFKPLVDPEAVSREKRLEVQASGETKAEVIKSLGIRWEGVSLRMPSGAIYFTQFYRYPNESSHLLNVFFSARREFHVIPSHADIQRDPAALYIEEEFLNGEIPLRFSFNDQWMERGKIFILQEDNTFKALELTPAEYRQCTMDSFRNPRNLEATDLYRKKIAPALGVPVEAE